MRLYKGLTRNFNPTLCFQSPTEEIYDLNKDTFYNLLDRVYAVLPRQLMKILVRNFKAKTGTEEIVNPSGLHVGDLAKLINILLIQK